MGLQHPGQHDREAVEHHLGQEDHQHPGAHLDGLLARGTVAEERPHEQGCGEGAGDRDRDEHRDRPGQQRARGPRDSGAVAVRDRTGEHGNDEGGERSAGDELEDEIGHGVGRGVDVADAGGPQRAGQHRDPAEADGPRGDGDERDAPGRSEQQPGRGPHGRRPARSTQRSGGTTSMTRL